MNYLFNFILLGMLGAPEIILISIFSGLVGLIPFIFYLLTLQNTFYAISPENRKMAPGQVWLSIIPFFGLVWQFIIVNRMADSLKPELDARNIKTNEERPGYSIGLAYCILFCCSIIPFLGFLTSIGGLVCWIMYWVKINDFKLQLKNR